MARQLDLDTDQMQAHIDDGVGWMVYDRPDRHNAMSREMIRAVPTIVDAFASDPEVRVVVVRGAGERSFVSGADISELGERSSNPADAMITGSGITALLALDKPVIAMVNGFCVGGGLLVALCADVRIAAEHAEFGIPAAKLGVAYPLEAVAMLVDAIGVAGANELLLTGDRIDSSVALRLGLVNRVVPASELEDAVVSVASAMAANAPLSLRAGKAAVRAQAAGAGPDDVAAAVAAIRAAWDSEDARLGPAAFAERRRPEFTGR